MPNYFYFCALLKCSLMKRVLVITQNDDGLGPMAAAFLRDYSTRLEVVSAGRTPAQSIHPLVVVSMKECLADLEGYVPKDLADVDASQFDLSLIHI